MMVSIVAKIDVLKNIFFFIMPIKTEQYVE